MNRELIVFKEMYLSYLGIEVARPYNKRITIAITKKREQVRNEIFRYPMIIIEMKKGFFISTSEQAFKEYKFWDRRTRLPKHLKELFYYLKAFYPEKSIRFMNRMRSEDHTSELQSHS